MVRGERNHQIPLTAPVQYPERDDLHIDPYVLGAWLGDGTSTKAEITSADQEILDEIERAGYLVAAQRTRPLVYRIGGTGHSRSLSTGRYVRNESLSSVLRTMGLLGQQAHPGALPPSVGRSAAGPAAGTHGYRRLRRRLRSLRFHVGPRVARRSDARVGGEPRLPADAREEASEAVRRRLRTVLRGAVHPGPTGLPVAEEGRPAKNVGPIPPLPGDCRRP